MLQLENTQKTLEGGDPGGSDLEIISVAEGDITVQGSKDTSGF